MDTVIGTVGVVESVARIGCGVGEGRATNVGVGLGIATGVVVVFGFGGLVMGSFKDAAIGGGTDVGATMASSSVAPLQAAMMAITDKIIGNTLVCRPTLCSLHVTLDAL